MGVSWVFDIDQSAKSVERMLEAAGADLLGPYSADVIPYVPTYPNADTNTIYVMHHNKHPQSTFTISPRDTFKQSPRGTSDRGFDLILSKMSKGTGPDLAGKIDINGNEYQLADFRVRVGTAVQGTAVKGCVVEVEYEPCQVVVQTKEIIAELIQSLFEKYHDAPPEVFMTHDKPEFYGALDTMWQYMHVATKLRKKT